MSAHRPEGIPVVHGREEVKKIVKVLEIGETDFVDGHDGQPDGVWCQANLAHDPKGAVVGFVERDHEDWPTVVVEWLGAWQIINRHRVRIWACEDCVGCIQDHDDRLGIPEAALEIVRFEWVDPDTPNPDCVANIQHAFGEGRGGQLVVDYGASRPRPHSVCGDCIEMVVADLHVMGWPTVVDEAPDRAQIIADREVG